MGKEKNKLFYSIGDVSKITGVKPYILRYWEKEFPFLQPLKNKSGHRLYTKRDIGIVLSIKELVYVKGYSVPGAKKVLWDSLLKRKRSAVYERIEDIKNDLYEMLEIINRNI